TTGWPTSTFRSASATTPRATPSPRRCCSCACWIRCPPPTGGRASCSGSPRTRAGSRAERGPPRDEPRSGLVALLEQPLALALPLAFALGLALVVLLLALGEADLELDPPARVVQVERHQRVAGALDLADQLGDLRRMQQQLAGAGRVGLDVRRGLG